MEIKHPMEETLGKLSDLLLELTGKPELLEEIKNTEKGFYVATKFADIEDPHEIIGSLCDDDVFYMKIGYKKYSEIEREE